MERDFLGAIGKGNETAVVEVAGGAESDRLGGGGGAQAMQWQFPAKAGAADAPPFMSFRSGREEEDSRKGVSDRFSFSGFWPPAPAPAGGTFGAITKQASPVTPHPQMQFGLDGGQASPQRYPAPAAAHGHRAQGMASYGVASHRPLGGSLLIHLPPRLNQGNQVHRVQSLPGAVGVYGARDLPNPNSAQMTIFYNGSVNVFDNVPVEKAQQLMLLVSRTSVPSPANRSDSPISAGVKFAAREVLPARQIIIQKPESCVPHVSGISSPIPSGSQAVTRSKSSSSSNSDMAVPTSLGVPLVVAPVNQASSCKPITQATTTAAAAMPRAVPQSRKASLARFLEKRKERVSTITPYLLSKSPLENSDVVGSAPSKSSCTDNAPSSNNGVESFCPGQSMNIISFGTEKFPSTKLQI